MMPSSPEPIHAGLEELRRLAETARRQNQLAVEEELWARVRLEYPDNPTGYARGGQCLMIQGRFSEAETLLSEGLAKFPTHEEIRFRHAERATLSSEFALGVVRFRDLCQRFPYHPNYFAELGSALMHEGRLEEAEQEFLASLAIAPFNAMAASGLGTLLGQVGRVAEASELFRAALEVSPNDHRLIMAHTAFVLEHADPSQLMVQSNASKCAEVRWQTRGSVYFEVIRHLIDNSAPSNELEPWLARILVEEEPGDAAQYIPVIMRRAAQLRRQSPSSFWRLLSEMRSFFELGQEYPIPKATRDLCKLYCDIRDAETETTLIQYLILLDLEHSHYIFDTRRNHQRAIVSQWIEQISRPGRLFIIPDYQLYKIVKLTWTLSEIPLAKFLNAFRIAFKNEIIDTRTQFGIVLSASRHREQSSEFIINAGPHLMQSYRGRPLRVALMVSGQLRGFRRAFNTWKNLCLADHKVDIYVHTWEKVGRKFPVRELEHEVFSGAFLDAYRKLTNSFKPAYIKEKYPSFHAMLLGNERVKKEELQDLFASEHVILEDDELSPYATWSNMEKMHYKVECCFNFALNNTEGYDLYVRIRPDLEIKEGNPVDWIEIHRNCTEKRVIYTERQHMFGDYGVSLVGDQLAIGTYDTQSIFLRARSFTINKRGQIFGLPDRLIPHRNFGQIAILGGIATALAPNIQVGYPPLDPTQLTPAEIKERLVEDTSKRKSLKCDKMLLQAVERDLEG